jgi:hypothetical protein
MDLPGDDQRVDDPPEIVARGKVDDRDLPGLEVDLTSAMCALTGK